MVRAPCCEKMGLKKGPWTPEEDEILVAYIQRYGHGNWRALPKLAGLPRCGKSCRLRWTNYLRPDIKRGNFTREEEDAIIKLHELLGNRWSTIAARLPGRTDNEIKNVWHTYLKKRLNQNSPVSETKSPHSPMIYPIRQKLEYSENTPVSPQQSVSESSIVTAENSSAAAAAKEEHMMIAEGEGSIWSEALSSDTSLMLEDFQANGVDSMLSSVAVGESAGCVSGPYNDESMDYWFNLFMQLPALTELPEF